MYQVLIKNNGEFYYLRGTTWTFEAMRGQVFESVEHAEKAILMAQAYTKPKAFKNVMIIAAGFEPNDTKDADILLERTLR